MFTITYDLTYMYPYKGTFIYLFLLEYAFVHYDVAFGLECNKEFLVLLHQPQ